MTWNQTQKTMEIDSCKYVSKQSMIVYKLRDISDAMRDILFVLDEDLSETIARRKESVFSAVNIVSNTLRDYYEELEKVSKKYQKAKNQKGE